MSINVTQMNVSIIGLRALICIIILFTWAVTPQPGSGQDLVERFRKDAPQAWRVYQQFAENLQSDYIQDKKQLAGDKSLEFRAWGKIRQSGRKRLSVHENIDNPSGQGVSRKYQGIV